jgi:ketosteroid isomerase-like protein
MGAVDPSALHALVEQGFNDGDVEALVRLYEPGARMVRDDGTAAVGTDEIRALLTGLLEPGGRIGVVTRYAVEAGDLALLSNVWTYEDEGGSFSSVTAEVARRQDDGSWRYVIDNPYAGAPDAPAEA